MAQSSTMSSARMASSRITPAARVAIDVAVVDVMVEMLSHAKAKARAAITSGDAPLSESNQLVI